MDKIKNSLPLLISGLMHILIVMLLALDNTKPAIEKKSYRIVGANKIIQSKLVSSRVTAATHTQNKPFSKTKNSIQKPKQTAKLYFNRKTAQKIKHSLSLSKTIQSSKDQKKVHPKLKGKEINLLVSHIYRKLQDHKKIPTLIKKNQHKKVKVIVEFTLSITGALKQLSIVQSSQIKSVDDAALNTVKAAAPFQLAKQYLKAPQRFALPIRFVI